MQWYTQDTLASITSGTAARGDIFSFQPNPDETQAWNDFNNDAANFMFYHKIGYVGAGEREETLEQLRGACKYMAQAKPHVLFLLGHWDSGGSGITEDMCTPQIYEVIKTFPGCDLGDRVKFIDGHAHCNHVQERASDGESVGFLIGGHGMSGCDQLGFAFIDSTKEGVAVYYFEETNSSIQGRHKKLHTPSCPLAEDRFAFYLRSE